MTDLTTTTGTSGGGHPVLLNRREIAERINIKPRTARRLTDDNTIPTVRVGRYIYAYAEDVDAYARSLRERTCDGCGEVR